ncbi:MAG: carboxymuconolactone decarboxylase family protein [Halioglobus sp.]
MDFKSAQRESDQRPKPVDVALWPPELSAIAADMNGKPINVHKLMANNPALLNAWWTFRNHSVTGGTLGLRKAELLILRVGVHMNSWYEWGSHVDRALKLGIDIDEIHRVLEPDTLEHWPTDDAALLRAVDELTRDHSIQAKTLTSLEQHHSNAQIMDLIAIHGMYLILAGMIKTWGLTLDADVAERIAKHTDEASFLVAARCFGKDLN